MSLHDPNPTRKPSRLGLYLPFVILGVAVVAWSAAWMWAKGQAASRLDAAVADANRAGWQVGWKTRTIDGYPFRMDVTLTDVSIREPGGWGIDSPRLEGEAFMHALTNWLVAAPDGLTFVRPIGGPVRVSGKLVRASLSNFDKRPPSFSFEGVDLVFQPQPGARPYFLTKAGSFEFHLRARPDDKDGVRHDEGGLYMKLDGGKADPATIIGRIAGEKPVSMAWNSTLS